MQYTIFVKHTAVNNVMLTYGEMYWKKKKPVIPQNIYSIKWKNQIYSMCVLFIVHINIYAISKPLYVNYLDNLCSC